MRSSLSICPQREDGSGLLSLRDPSPHQISMLGYWFLSVKIIGLGIFNLMYFIKKNKYNKQSIK